MSPRRLAQIAGTLSFPTIKDYFGMMANEQREDILRLKRTAIGRNSEESAKPPTDRAVPDPWLLHPIRRTGGSPAKSSAKSGAQSAKKAPKKAEKKAAKKASKKSRG